MSEPSETAVGLAADYEALRNGAGLVTGTRALVWVRGPDSVGFTDGQVSQDVAGMAEGSVARSLLLEPRGKLIALLWVMRGRDEVGILVDSGSAGPAVDALERYRFRVDAVIEDSLPVAELIGPSAPGVLAACGLPTPPGWATGADSVVASIEHGLPRYAVGGVDDDVLIAAGAVRVGAPAADAVRIELGEPVMGIDVDGSTIPQESGLVPASVSFTKGCYMGQELVARIDSRGRVNRHLRGLTVTGTAAPPSGAEIVVDGTTVGTITSVAESPRLGAVIGLGMVRREVEPGDGVDLVWEGGSTTGVVGALPFA